MKKIGVSAVLFATLLALAAVACGDPCGDLKTKEEACCTTNAKGNASVAASCKTGIDNAFKSAAAMDSSVCSAALSAFTCTAL